MRQWLFQISIRRILFGISLLFLFLPVGGIFFLRLYESALIRQTESELISQAAFIAALYKQEVEIRLKAAGLPPENYGLAVHAKPLGPIPARLDLSHDPIYPSRPSPVFTQDHLDKIANAAGLHVMPVLKDSQRVTLSGIKILDYQGIVTAGREERGLSFAHTSEFQKAIRGNAVRLIRQRQMPSQRARLSSASRNADVNVYVALPITLNNRLIGVVWVNRTPTELWQALYGKRSEVVWTGIALIVLTLLLSALTSYTITRPIRSLIQKTRLISEGAPEGQILLSNPITSEMAELSQSVAQMAQLIQARNDYIQNFVTHVSHEFKTPLTAIQGSVELLQDHLDKMPLEKQQRFLNNIAEDTHRLNRLVISLLELAKADVSEQAHDQTPVTPILLSLQDRYRHEPFDLTISTSKDFQVTLSQDTLEATLINLIENSRQAGATQLNITLSTSGSLLTITCQDNGTGISEANQKDIFTPFFTTRRETGGTGLGLSIVQTLLIRQGGKIRLVSSNAQGSCFELTLPLV